MNGDLSFNTYLLQTPNIVTNVIDHTDLPDQVMTLLAVANANKSVITEIEYPSRTISISGIIKGSSQVNLDQRIDAFKGYFGGINKNLDIDFAGSTRRYIATKNAISIKRRGAVKYATFKVEFICTDPFGHDITATTLVNQIGYTAATFNPTMLIEGTAPTQLPIITITVTAMTGTGDYIKLSNNANNQTILILGQSIAPGDVVVVDCEARRVTINGTEVDYTGVFFELELGNASLTYADGFTTRTVNIHAEYFKRYL